MTISRWKLMACALGLSLGGLTISAGQCDNPTQRNERGSAKAPQPFPLGLAAENPAPPRADTLPPLTIPAVSQPKSTTPPSPPVVKEFELVVPAAPPSRTPVLEIPDFTPAVAVPEVPVIPVSRTVREVLPMPRVVEFRTVEVVPDLPTVRVRADELLPPDTPTILEPKRGSTPPSSALPMVAPLDLAEDPPARKIEPKKVPTTKPPVVEFIPVPEVSKPVAPKVDTPARTEQQPSALQGNKLKLLLRMGVGTPRFEIRNAVSDELLLKVYADKIEMQSTEGVKNSPLAGISASGKVRFTGPGIEGTCEQLSILSGTGEVLLKGTVHMKTRLRTKTWSEMTADKMIYQIGTSGLTSPTTGTGTVKPTGYVPLP